MFRVVASVLAFSLAAPTSAFACGMYIPPTKHETETTLASVLDSIDAAVGDTIDAALAATKPADAKPSVRQNATTEPAAATTTAPAEDNSARAKRRPAES